MVQHKDITNSMGTLNMCDQFQLRQQNLAKDFVAHALVNTNQDYVFTLNYIPQPSMSNSRPRLAENDINDLMIVIGSNSTLTQSSNAFLTLEAVWTDKPDNVSHE